MVHVSEERFDEMVNDALDKIPDQFVANMRNLVILVRDFNEDSPGILGLYEASRSPNAPTTTRAFYPTPSSSTAAPYKTCAPPKNSLPTK